MEGKYPVMAGNETVGWAWVTRQGLYYGIHCRCNLEKDEIIKLRLVNEESTQHVGILAPIDGKFGLDTQIPMKRLGQKIWRFEAISGKTALEDRFIPVFPEKPFPNLACLKDARFERRGDQIGVAINTPLRK